MDSIRKKKQRIIPPERRKKVAKACDSCKRRKRKCNGLLPCELCSVKQFSCEYTAIDRRILKPSKKQLEERKKLQEANMEVKEQEKVIQPQYYHPELSYSFQNALQMGYVSNYYNTNHQPIQQISNQQPIHPIQQHLNLQQHQHQHLTQQQHTQHIPQPHTQQSLPIQQPLQNHLQNHTYPSLSSTPNSLQNLLSFSVNIHPHDEDDEEMYNETISAVEDGQNSRIIFDNFGNLCYFGECSPTSYLLQTRKLFEKVLGENEFSFDPEKQSNLVERKIFNNESTEFNKNKLPDRKYADYLLETYLNNSNNIVYILDDEELKMCLNRVYLNPNSVTLRDICILNLIFGIASIYAKVELNKKIFPFNESYFINPEVFYKLSNSILTENTENCNIWTVEAYLLSFFYLQFIGKRNSAWIKLGLAIRYAQSIGLNRKYINESFKDPSHVLHRRKIFRSLFIMDRLSSIYLGRSMTISEEDWDDFKSFENIVDFQSNLLKVTQLNGEVLKKIYYNPKINLKVALNLQYEIKKYSIENPILINENIQRPLDHKFFLPHICHLHGYILLARPFFHFFVLKKFGIVEYNKSSKNYIHLRNFYQSCIKSSVLIIKVVEYVYHQNVHPFKPLGLISCTFHAGLIIGLVLLLKFKHIKDDILNDDTEREVFKNIDLMLVDSMNSAINMLESYGEIDKASKIYCEVLKKIVKVTNNSINDDRNNDNQLNYENLIKFKDWLFPKLDTELNKEVHEDVNYENQFKNGQKFLDDFYFSVLDDKLNKNYNYYYQE